MSSLLRVVARFFLLLSLVTQGWAGFNCTRTGCQNGGVCEAAGTCQCIGSTYVGYDCSQDQMYIMHGSCLSNNPCQNGGTCYETVTLGVSCYCPYDFYGAHCDLPRVQNECFSDQMIVNINPYTHGSLVGIQHNTHFCELAPVTSQVQFTLDPIRSQWRGYAAVLPFTATIPCGAGAQATPVGAEMTYTYDVIVRYGGKPELDEMISFSCTVPYMAGAVPGPTAVLFSVADSQGVAVDKPKVGSPITITFKVDPYSIFTDVAVRSCTVYNAMKTVSKAVVINYCAVQPFGMTLVKQGDKHVLTLRVHTFGRDPSLLFECSVKVCTVSDYTCQQLPACYSPNAPAGAGTSDLLGLLMSPSPGGSTGSGSLSLSDLLGGGGGGPSGGGSSAGGWSGTGTNDLASLLGGTTINDWLAPAGGSGTAAPAAGGGGTAGRRRRRDVSGLSYVTDEDDDDVIMVVRGTL
ncbi:EGF-like domain-containing protein 2 [Babylonia areolata]|uniref:EGF-like domain-containing protein 2 n=1 Tax=Babylonia areolata TaxID=304850 RepID=UPI003FD698F3